MMKKTLLLTILFSCSSLLSFGQEREFDKDHTIDYLVVFDNSKKPEVEKAGGEEAFAQKIVESINLVLKNSNLEYCFRVAGTYHMDATAPSIVEGLDMVGNSAEVQKQRRVTKSDIVVLIAEPYGDANSGLANHMAKHPDAYTCVLSSMAINSYTATHEAAHILGCYHSRSEYDHSPSTHPWAAAYIAPEGYKTVMNTIAPGELVPIFSGPESIWKGVVMGDETHDNVRMLRQTLPKVVHYGDYLEPDKYYASEERLSFNKSAQHHELTIYGNSFFMISTSAPWIKLSGDKFGTVEANVQLDIEANTTGKDRTGTLVIEGDYPERTLRIPITQSATDEITGINTPSLEIYNHGIFTLSGQKVSKKEPGRVYIQDGQKIIAR